MTQEQISSYIKVGMFSTEVLETEPTDGSLRWYYRHTDGVLHVGTASSRFTALNKAEALGFDSMI